MGGGTTRKTTRVRFTKGEGMEKGLKYRPHVDPLPKKDPDLDIDNKGCGGGCGGCKPAGPNFPLSSYPDDEVGWKPKGGGKDPLPRLILKGKGD